MRSRRTLVLCAVLGVLVVVAAGLEGGGVFSGVRWVPDWNFGQEAPPPLFTNRPLPPKGTNLPQPVPGAGSGIDVGRILLWVAIGLAVALALFLLWRWWSRRPPRKSFGLREIGALTAPPPAAQPKPEPEPEPDAPVLRRGVEQALLLLDAEREPGDAVMRAWLGLQQTAEESGIQRRAAETATEFTSRIMRSVSADDRAIRTLLNLYLRTRFGDHPVTGGDVERAREALEGLAKSWNDRAVAGRGAKR